MYIDIIRVMCGLYKQVFGDAIWYSFYWKFVSFDSYYGSLDYLYVLKHTAMCYFQTQHISWTLTYIVLLGIDLFLKRIKVFLTFFELRKLLRYIIFTKIIFLLDYLQECICGFCFLGIRFIKFCTNIKHNKEWSFFGELNNKLNIKVDKGNSRSLLSELI